MNLQRPVGRKVVLVRRIVEEQRKEGPLRVASVEPPDEVRVHITIPLPRALAVRPQAQVGHAEEDRAVELRAEQRRAPEHLHVIALPHQFLDEHRTTPLAEHVVPVRSRQPVEERKHPDTRRVPARDVIGEALRLRGQPGQVGRHLRRERIGAPRVDDDEQHVRARRWRRAFEGRTRVVEAHSRRELDGRGRMRHQPVFPEPALRGQGPVGRQDPRLSGDGRVPRGIGPRVDPVLHHEDRTQRQREHHPGSPAGTAHHLRGQPGARCERCAEREHDEPELEPGPRCEHEGLAESPAGDQVPDAGIQVQPVLLPDIAVHHGQTEPRERKHEAHRDHPAAPRHDQCQRRHEQQAGDRHEGALGQEHRDGECARTHALGQRDHRQIAQRQQHEQCRGAEEEPAAPAQQVRTDVTHRGPPPRRARRSAYRSRPGAAVFYAVRRASCRDRPTHGRAGQRQRFSPPTSVTNQRAMAVKTMMAVNSMARLRSAVFD